MPIVDKNDEKQFEEAFLPFGRYHGDFLGEFLFGGRGRQKKKDRRLRADTIRLLEGDRSTDGSAGLQQITNLHQANEGQDLQNLEATGANVVREVASGSSRGIRQGVTDVANQVNVKRDANRAKGLANRVSEVTRGTFNRNTATMDLSDRQKRAGSRRLSLNRSVNEASAGSAVRSAGADASRNAMSAGVALENMTFSQEIAGLSGLANAEGQETIRLAAEKAAEKEEQNAMGGAGAGMAISIISMFSSEDWKDKVEESPKLLDKLKRIRVDKWRYKGDKADGSDHIGPYAEEFNEVFGTQQQDTRMINAVDAIGIALGVVKELDLKVEALTNVR